MIRFRLNDLWIPLQTQAFMIYYYWSKCIILIHWIGFLSCLHHSITIYLILTGCKNSLRKKKRAAGNCWFCQWLIILFIGTNCDFCIFLNWPRVTMATWVDYCPMVKCQTLNKFLLCSNDREVRNMPLFSKPQLVQINAGSWVTSTDSS